MTRVTEKQLESLVDRLNKATNMPRAYTDKSTNRPHKINIGHYYIDKAYDGNKLVQIITDGGGVQDVSSNGYTTKRDLYNQLQTLIKVLNSIN